MTMPARVQPGPMAADISYAAPVSLFFFFFLMMIITTLRDIDLHPMNYFSWPQRSSLFICCWLIWWTMFPSMPPW